MERFILAGSYHLLDGNHHTFYITSSDTGEQSERVTQSGEKMEKQRTFLEDRFILEDFS